MAENIDISGYKRNPDVIRNSIKEDKDIFIAKTRLRVHIPERFFSRLLGKITDNVNALAVCAIIDDNNNYGVLLLNALLEFTPNIIKYVTIKEVDYVELVFMKGTAILATKDIIQEKKITYDIFDEHFLQSRVPWFLNYEDLSDMFYSSRFTSGSNISDNSTAFEALTAIMARQDGNLKQFYRMTDYKKPPVFVPLQSIYYSYNSTTAKLLGTYKNKAIVSALTEKSKNVTKTEKLLRS